MGVNCALLCCRPLFTMTVVLVANGSIGGDVVSPINGTKRLVSNPLSIPVPGLHARGWGPRSGSEYTVRWNDKPASVHWASPSPDTPETGQRWVRAGDIKVV